MRDYKKEIEDILRDEKLSRQEKIDKLEKIKEKRDKAYEIEGLRLKTQNVLGGILIIGSTLIPSTAVLKVLGGISKFVPSVEKLIPIVAKTIVNSIKWSKPLIRQIVSNAIKKAVQQGAIYGGLYGIGKSVQEAKTLGETVDEITEDIVDGIIFTRYSLHKTITDCKHFLRSHRACRLFHG